MKKIMFFVAAAFALVAVGCSKDDVANEGVEYVSELKLNFGKGDSRVAVTHNPASGLKFAWEDGEEIMVLENGNANSITYYYVYDAATESFKPKYDSYKMTAGKEYFAVNHTRGTSIFLSVEDGKSVVKMNIERKEPYGLSNIPMITDVFTADADGTIATMHHLVGVVEIPVKLAEDSNVTEVDKFSLFVSGAKLGRDFTATPEAPYVKDISEAYDTSSVAGCELSTETATSIFIPVLPGEYGEGYFNFYYSDGSTYVKTEAMTVKRGMITKLTEKTKRLKVSVEE